MVAIRRHLHIMQSELLLAGNRAATYPWTAQLSPDFVASSLPDWWPLSTFMTTPTVFQKNWATVRNVKDSTNASPSRGGNCICDHCIRVYIRFPTSLPFIWFLSTECQQEKALWVSYCLGRNIAHKSWFPWIRLWLWEPYSWLPSVLSEPPVCRTVGTRPQREKKARQTTFLLLYL